MKSIAIFAIVVGASFIVAGCSTDAGSSPAQEAAIKKGFQAQSIDMSKLTPEQKAGFEKWKQSGGAQARK